MPGERDLQADGSPLARDRLDARRAAQRRGAIRHTGQSVAVTEVMRVETAAVIVDSEPQPGVAHREYDVHLCCAGVAGDVVDAFLEDQENLAAQIDAQSYTVASDVARTPVSAAPTLLSAPTSGFVCIRH
jgi:hypothetical protein